MDFIPFVEVVGNECFMRHTHLHYANLLAVQHLNVEDGRRTAREARETLQQLPELGFRLVQVNVHHLALLIFKLHLQPDRKSKHGVYNKHRHNLA